MVRTQAEMGVDDQEGAHPTERRGRPEWWPRARRIGRAVLVLGAMAGVGIAVRSWFETRDATDRAEAALEEARAELDGTYDDLEAVNAELAARRATLAGELWTLDLRETERDAVQATLDALAVQLVDLVAQRDAASAVLAGDTARLDALQRCLVGVAEALNQASVGDTGGVATTLRGIEGSCSEAGVAL